MRPASRRRPRRGKRLRSSSQARAPGETRTARIRALPDCHVQTKDAGARAVFTIGGYHRRVHLTYREWWSFVHGFVFGGGFLLSFTGVAIVMYGLRRDDLTEHGLALHVLWLRLGTVAMAAAAWGAVILGTWVMYPWYRTGGAKAGLLASPQTSNWDHFGMEWKQHIAWFAPFLATTAAFLALYFGERLERDRRLRLLTLAVFSGAFVAAAVTAIFGAFITRNSPVL
jgi:hypothetical protein